MPPTPDELSLLHALFYMRSGGSFDMLTRSEGGAQQDRLSGGVEPLATALADHVEARGGRIELGSPVERIVRDRDGVTIHAGGRSLRGRRAIITTPPPLTASLRFEPALSPERAELFRRLPMGAVIKCIAAYERPFWRHRGYSGQSVSDQGPVHVTFDASPESGIPGLLMGFIEGPAARAMAGWSETDRREVVLDAFARSFGSDALEPRTYLDRAWTEEAFSQGCYAALFPPGLWTTCGQVLRRPEGRLHWAGTETSAVWCGYVEGAVRSGERAAEEVLARDV